MATIEIEAGGLWVKDPQDSRVIQFSFSDLPDGVELSAATVARTALKPSTSDTNLTVSASGSGLGLVSGNRAVNVQVAAGTLGQRYEVTVHGTTNETPPQEFDRSVEVLVEHL